MTKEDVTKSLGLDKETFDYALPQDWVDKVYKCLPQNLQDGIVPHFVWLYDKEAKIFGRPCSISPMGNLILNSIINIPNLHMNARCYVKPIPPTPTLQQAFLLGRVLGLVEGGWNNDALDVAGDDSSFFKPLSDELDKGGGDKWGLGSFLKDWAKELGFDLHEEKESAPDEGGKIT